MTFGAIGYGANPYEYPRAYERCLRFLLSPILPKHNRATRLFASRRTEALGYLSRESCPLLREPCLLIRKAIA